MAPILGVLKEIALAPFGDAIPVDTGTRRKTLYVFSPSLPRIRNRRHYVADVGKKSKVQLCTKRYTGHPSLTPGIFTLFCPHGMFLLRTSCTFICNALGICYGFEAMRLHESPNTPFSIVYERFPEGMLVNNDCHDASKCMQQVLAS